MTDEIVRDAKLFEAGSYSDKGLEVTEDDLDAIVAGPGSLGGYPPIP